MQFYPSFVSSSHTTHQGSVSLRPGPSGPVGVTAWLIGRSMHRRTRNTASPAPSYIRGVIETDAGPCQGPSHHVIEFFHVSGS